jgi:NAD(P)-dependent dehydrogenase (short-subunit alcohol dehydrogenase family)
MKINGSVALVTGANRGLGKAFVEALSRAGAAKIYAAARDPASIVPAAGVVPIQLDVTNPEHIRSAAAELRDVSVLINNAGIGIRAQSALDPTSSDVLRKEMETNVFGPLSLIQAFAPTLAANGGGAVLNVLSVLSWISVTGVETYCATKSAAWSLTNGLRHVLGEQGTQVVALHVGYMDTDMTRNLSVPKADPNVVATNAISAIESGEVEILADATSVQLKGGLSSGVYLKPIPRARTIEQPAGAP